MTHERKQVYVYDCVCERCGHKWQTKGDKLPKTCANLKCKSIYWDRPKRKKEEK